MVKWRQAPRVASRRVDDEAVLMPVRASVGEQLKLHALNPVAACVWALLDGTRDEDSLVAAVVREFEVEEARARSDLASFLHELEAAGLVERA